MKTMIKMALKTGKTRARTELKTARKASTHHDASQSNGGLEAIKSVNRAKTPTMRRGMYALRPAVAARAAAVLNSVNNSNQNPSDSHHQG